MLTDVWGVPNYSKIMKLKYIMGFIPLILEKNSWRKCETIQDGVASSNEMLRISNKKDSDKSVVMYPFVGALLVEHMDRNASMSYARARRVLDVCLGALPWKWTWKQDSIPTFSSQLFMVDFGWLDRSTCNREVIPILEHSNVGTVL